MASSWTVVSARVSYVGQQAVVAVAFAADVAHNQSVAVGAAVVELQGVTRAWLAAVRPQSAPRLQVAAFAEMVNFHCQIVAARSSRDECYCSLGMASVVGAGLRQDDTEVAFAVGEAGPNLT
jgi:hypothetical protein